MLILFESTIAYMSSNNRTLWRQVEHLALFDIEYLSVKFVWTKTSPPTYELEGFNIDGDLGYD